MGAIPRLLLIWLDHGMLWMSVRAIEDAARDLVELALPVDYDHISASIVTHYHMLKELFLPLLEPPFMEPFISTLCLEVLITIMEFSLSSRCSSSLLEPPLSLFYFLRLLERWLPAAPSAFRSSTSSLTLEDRWLHPDFFEELAPSPRDTDWFSEQHCEQSESHSTISPEDAESSSFAPATKAITFDIMDLRPSKDYLIRFICFLFIFEI